MGYDSFLRSSHVTSPTGSGPWGDPPVSAPLVSGRPRTSPHYVIPSMGTIWAIPLSIPPRVYHSSKVLLMGLASAGGRGSTNPRGGLLLTVAMTRGGNHPARPPGSGHGTWPAVTPTCVVLTVPIINPGKQIACLAMWNTRSRDLSTPRDLSPILPRPILSPPLEQIWSASGPLRARASCHRLTRGAGPRPCQVACNPSLVGDAPSTEKRGSIP